MKKYYKSVFLAAIMSIFSIGTSFAADLNDGTFTYSVNNNTYVTVTGLVNSSAKIENPTIGPSVILDGKEYTVNGVEANAFLNKTNISGQLTLSLKSHSPSYANPSFVGSNAFAGTNISSLIFYSYTPTSSIGSLRMVGNNAFANCSNLQEIVLIGAADYNFAQNSPFVGCSNVQKVVWIGNSYTYLNNTTPFPTEITSKATMYVPAKDYDTLKNYTGWNQFKKFETAESLIEELSISPEELYIPTWDKGERFPIEVNIVPSYLGYLATGNLNQGSNIPEEQLGTYLASVYPFTSFTVTNSYYPSDFASKLPADIPLTLTIGNKSATIIVYLGEATLSIQFNSGFKVSQKMKRNQPIDVYLLPHRDYEITSVVRSTPTTTEEVSVPKRGGRYTETLPIKQNTNLQVNLRATGDEPTTGVESVVGEESPVVVLVSGHNIVVEGADDGDVVTVTNIAGQTVYSGVSKSVNVAESGIYIVTVGNNSQKVVVK